MSKLNLLKWIYELGYKKAEDRYYYAIMEHIRIRQANNPNMHKRINEDDRDLEKRKAEELRLFNELRVLVDNVFHPQEYVETKVQDRFLP